MHRYFPYCVGIALLALSPAVQANTFRFDTDPFSGTNARNTPGRQVVGGENFLSFSIADDVFSMDTVAFGLSGPVNFVNAAAPNLPTGGVNVVVLDTFDNDNNSLTPFGAGNAADLIAGQITTPGAGFFVYFNQGLDLPRLVFSTDLNDNTADLKILARMLNLTGQNGRDAMPTFTQANFDISPSPTPEPGTYGLIAGACVIGAICHIRRRRSVQD